MLAQALSYDVAAEAADGFGRLVSVCRPCTGSDTLVVYFNVYLNKAHGRPDLPHGTRFDALRGFANYRAHLAWFVEECETWYLAHQGRIVDTLACYVQDNGIARVKLVGGSAGGYAAIRIGMLLDRRLARVGADASIVAFACNPQTGFSDRLLGVVERELADAGWDTGLLGHNPIVLAPELRRVFAPLALDLAELGRAEEAHNFAVLVLNDEDNPIERAFTRDIADWPHLYHAPQFLGVGHGEGAELLYQHAFWPAFDEVYPVERDGSMSAELLAM